MYRGVVSKGARSMRIVALPLARVRVSPGAKLEPSFNTNNLLLFYHFDLVLPCPGRKDPSWHKEVLKSVTDKAVGLWTNLGKGPKGSWKLWTYELGQRIADQIEFEELALRDVDPSLGPTVSTGTSTKQVSDVKKDSGHSHSLPKIPLIYPPSVYPAGAAHTLHPSLADLQTLLATRGPRHRRGFYLWMLIAPLTLPIMLIPIVPNLPLFFCVWRSWSHYRAYRSSRYLSSVLDLGMIEPNPSLELDKLYASFASSPGVSHQLSSSLAPCLEKTSTSVNDGKSKAAPGPGESLSECIILPRETIPQILEVLSLPESIKIDMHRAMNQTHIRLKKST